MSGYGGDDDAAEMAQHRVDERVALVRSMLPTGPGKLNCIECGDPIPEARRVALPGVTCCVDCQEHRDSIKPKFKEPWAT